MRRKELFYYVTSGSNVTLDVLWYVTVDYQQIVNSNLANQIHGFTIDYGKCILVIFIIWLAPWAGNINQIPRAVIGYPSGHELSCTLGITRRVSREKISLKPNINPLLIKLFRSRWLDIKPWPNGVASRRKLKTWVYLRLRLARPCAHLRWLARTCAHFGRDQICTQVEASFSPFGHPTQVNASWVTSIKPIISR